MQRETDVLDLAGATKARGEPFALATVVRTVSVTAAKAGSKAVILPNGEISAGWIGGGCARGAVLRAARAAMADGVPRLVSIQPEDVLEHQQLRPGLVKDGILYAGNHCPSQGTMDIFIEPVLPRPHLSILGSSPVALALVDIATRMGFFVTLHVLPGERDAAARHLGASAARLCESFDLQGADVPDGYVVIATQSRGDVEALKAVADLPARYIGFVGSRRKFSALVADIAAEGRDTAYLDRIRSPAGLDIGSITPDEIAFSIVAEMIERRRHGQRIA
jgi:xanthine dehydrogenase accessory factor